MADKAPGAPEGLSTEPVTDLPALETEPSTTPDGTQPEAAPAPKRRRKRGPNKPKTAAVTGDISDPNKERQELAQLSEALGASFQMTGNIIASVRGSDHWKVSGEEAKNLGDVWAVALRPYMGAMAPYMPFVAATVVTVGVFAPKVRRDRELQRNKLEATRGLPSMRVELPVVSEGGSSAASQLDRDPETMTTPTPDAPHLAVEGGFLPPNVNTETAPTSRRRRNATTAS